MRKALPSTPTAAAEVPPTLPASARSSSQRGEAVGVRVGGELALAVWLAEAVRVRVAPNEELGVRGGVGAALPLLEALSVGSTV